MKLRLPLLKTSPSIGKNKRYREKNVRGLGDAGGQMILNSRATFTQKLAFKNDLKE